ncbi:MAG: hypothetical protein B7Z59_11900 [Acidiphilium sp. 37-67-22]|nr:MAG: hypothetical protein B7X09_03010 [Acidiphilium sp. 21-66-27]OYW07355.1 MAG: hypothetical protein B7Z59_11900 [Acidiphilium sp. 37-67-22]
MGHHQGPTIDMTVSGDFRDLPTRKPSLVAIAARLLMFGIALGFVAMLFWLAVFTLPVLLLAGAAIYLYARFAPNRGAGPAGPAIRIFRF